MKAVIVFFVLVLAALLCVGQAQYQAQKRAGELAQAQVQVSQDQAQAIKAQAEAIKVQAEANARAIDSQAQALQAQAFLLNATTIVEIGLFGVVIVLVILVVTTHTRKGVES